MAAILLATLGTCSLAQANNIDYEIDGQTYQGYYAAPQANSKGQVLLIHDWDGIDDYEKKRADMLAADGYATFAVDLYGKDVRPDKIEDKKAEVGKLYNDRDTMRQRIQAGLTQLRAHSGQQPTVVMGYCFGGGATLELARSGVDTDVVGYASFHGTLATPAGQSYPTDTAPILTLHGGADTAIPMQDVAALAETLESASVPYEIAVYSGAPHAFTVFDSARYQQTADEKSWAAFSDFLNEQFGK
ncbi:dienelactone hydrolase family protein [Ostreibacterium oceani]|uniref:dienelactone hydrolase family protein n=1 Tax=Ostreibacterium oceani TaxID=2654998 RepID=UPI0038B397AB